MKKTILNILQWIFVGLCFILIIGMGFSVYGIAMLLLGVVSMPIKPIKNIWGKVFKSNKWLKPIIIAVAFVVVLGFYGSTVPDVPDIPNDIVSSDYITGDVDVTSSDVTTTSSITSSNQDGDSSKPSILPQSSDISSVVISKPVVSSNPVSSIPSSSSRPESIISSSSSRPESSKPDVTSKPVSSETVTSSKSEHTHSFSAPDCNTPAKCACGETKGEALGHDYSAATCTEPQRCSRCSSKKGSPLGHKYLNGQCENCGKKQPGYVEKTTYVLNTDTMKFHYESCWQGKRIKPENKDTYYGTSDEVISKGYSPCGTCKP